MLVLAEQAVAPRDVEVAVRNEEIRKIFAEERERVLAVLFEGVGRNHDEFGACIENLRIILLQRSSHAGGSVRVISVTVLSRENEFLMPRCELVQREFAVRS